MGVGGSGKDFDNMRYTVRPILLRVTCNPSSLQLLDVFGALVLPIAEWDGDVGESPVVLFVAVGNRVEDFFVPTNPLLEVFDPLLVATPLLRVVRIALLKGDGEATRDGSQRVGVDIVVAIKDGEG